MCRLFGMASRDRPVTARFWLLDALDSLVVQSRREPDGSGLGWFDVHGAPMVQRDPVPAWRDPQFSHLARTVSSRRFVAHVRYASTGAVDMRNTHPFVQEGRLFAHNGVVEHLDLLRAELGDDLALVHGDTDSELTFALVTRETRAADGDIAEGIRRAGEWIAEHLPVYAWNIVIATEDELHALRWPDVHELWWLDREPGGHRPGAHVFMGAGAHEPLAVESLDLAERSAVVVASEPMDDHPGWQRLASGELLSVGSDGVPRCRQLLDQAPARVIT
ncbi:MAG: class II glutamine amidotransferase, partial [Thermoleophilia bacterium]|nr:class II glutamine amidotransferase [Thermoleophilia bacterium]